MDTEKTLDLEGIEEDAAEAERISDLYEQTGDPGDKLMVLLIH